jgi:hypothetical protein
VQMALGAQVEKCMENKEGYALKPFAFLFDP